LSVDTKENLVFESSASVSKLEQIQAWLAPFGEKLTHQILNDIDKDFKKTLVLGPTHTFSEFGLNPNRMLNLVLSTIEKATHDLPVGGNILWLIDSSQPSSLTKIEAEAVFGDGLAIKIIEEVEIGEKYRRLVILAIPREEYVGLVFHLPTDFKEEMTCSIFEFLLSQDTPIAGLFLTFSQAKLLLDNQDSMSVWLLKKLLEEQKISLALSIPHSRTAFAVRDIANEILPLRLLSPNVPVRLVRFEDTNEYVMRRDLLSSLRSAGLQADTSFGYNQFESCQGVSGADYSSYLPLGAYQPQHFDCRIPTGQWQEEGFLELITLKLSPELSPTFSLEWLEKKRTHEKLDACWMIEKNVELNNPLMFENWEKLWDFRTHLQLSRLLLLLDFKRKDSYLNSLKNSDQFLDLSQQYHENIVYNWPANDPWIRTTLVDCGELDRIERVKKVLIGAKNFKSCFNFRFRFVNQIDLLVAGQKESKERVADNTQLNLEKQKIEHIYLKDNNDKDMNSLREDLVKFIDFIPKKLGTTLEVGSGFGQLASVLASRCTSYYCLDLTLEMLFELDNSKGLQGLVADFHHLPLCDSSLDTIIANNVLEHSYDPLRSLKEIHRVLRPGGTLFALIPFEKLNPNHHLPAHLWKSDQLSIELACAASNLQIRKLEVIDIYKLGVAGSFSSCHGLHGMLDIVVQK